MNTIIGHNKVRENKNEFDRIKVADKTIKLIEKLTTKTTVSVSHFKEIKQIFLCLLDTCNLQRFKRDLNFLYILK